MKYVIDIPNEMHKALEQGSFGAKYNMYDIVGCVMNGTPLPKGHGELIERQAVVNNIANTNFYLSSDNWSELINAINDTSTIIEADKESE